MPWYASVISKALNYIGKETLGTEVPLGILFFSFHTVLNSQM